MTTTYPDVEAVLARLAEEEPPAHVRAQRLAELHIAMAEASHSQLFHEVQALARGLQAMREALQAATKQNAEGQAEQGDRLSALSQAVEILRQQIGAIGQPLAYRYYVLVALAGSCVGLLLLIGIRL